MSSGKKVFLWIFVFVSILTLFSLACTKEEIESIKNEPKELKKDVDTQVKEFKDLVKSFDYPHTD